MNCARCGTLNVTTGTSTYDLTRGTVVSSKGAIRKSGVIARSDHWYKPWLQMRSSNVTLRSGPRVIDLWCAF